MPVDAGSTPADLPVPFEACAPEGRYVFVSYAHADKAAVYPELARIRSLGVRVWYDDGIGAGREWPQEIAAALAGAAAVVVMITPGAVASRNVRNEVNLAVARGITVLAVHLAETELPAGLELQLGAIQAVLAWRLDSESYASRLARMLAGYGADASPPGTAGAQDAAVPRPAGVAPAGEITLPAMLPPGPRWFTGRSAELEVLDGLPDGRDGASAGGPVLAAVTGTAGAGKTSLALHWAHQAAHRFPGGQLYVNLRGYDPAGSASTAEAAAAFLDALGVPPGRIPPAEEAQAGLYRRLAAGRQLLIVLDNASEPAQVRPLLPPSPATVVIVTSRSAMTGLAAADGAVLVPVGLLDDVAASELLAARLGQKRLAAEPGAAEQIAAACAGLPLALAVTAARAAATPGQPLAAVAAQLAVAAGGGDPGGTLDVLDTGEEATSVRAVFSWSYRQLSEGAARMFALLGLHPGPDISGPAAAALAGTPARTARQHLAELAAASLTTEQPPGRYLFHDLLRAYATEQAEETQTEGERNAAARRIIGYYLHHTYQAAKFIWPPITRYLREPIPAAEQGDARTINDRDGALAWFRAEQQNLPQVLAWAARLQLDSEVVQLNICMEPYDRLRILPGISEATLAAAQRLGDHAAVAQGYYHMARLASHTASYDEAESCYRRTLENAELAGNLDWQAMAHQGLAEIYDDLGRAGEAVEHARRAVELADAAGAREAEFLSQLGFIEARAGDIAAGLADCREAVRRLRASESQLELAAGLGNLGGACQVAGLPGEAIEHFREAIALFQAFDFVLLEAISFKWLGDAHAATGDADAARDAWQQALDILRDLAPSHPYVGEIRTSLSQVSPDS